MQIGVTFGNPETTPEKKALKFYTSVRIDIRRIAQIKKLRKLLAHESGVKVVKTRLLPHFVRQNSILVQTKAFPVKEK